MIITINDTVINPTQVDPQEFLAELYKAEPKNKTVTHIIERDLDTDEKGYTKRVNSSSQPDAYVFLDGGSKYRLSELTKA